VGQEQVKEFEEEGGEECFEELVVVDGVHWGTGNEMRMAESIKPRFSMCVRLLLLRQDRAIATPLAYSATGTTFQRYQGRWLCLCVAGIARTSGFPDRGFNGSAAPARFPGR
jgi:hypothetical protein